MQTVQNRNSTVCGNIYISVSCRLLPITHCECFFPSEEKIVFMYFLCKANKNIKYSYDEIAFFFILHIVLCVCIIFSRETTAYIGLRNTIILCRGGQN